MAHVEKAVLPWDDEHFAKYGMKRGTVEQWEDGIRIPDGRHGYEWWYFDNHMDDGTAVVVAFFVKPILNINGPMAPYVSLEITAADGSVVVSDEVRCSVQDCSFSQKGCDVRIGACTAKGDLTDYHVHYESPRVTFDLDLHGTIPSWRPGVSGILFGDDEAKDFFWLPSVPEGRSTATLRTDGATRRFEGSGYHDHNWGNTSLADLCHHWYWGRSKFGPYTVINVWITAQKKYGYKGFGVFLLAKDGKIITGNEDGGMRFATADPRVDATTGKPYSAHLEYAWDAPDGSQYRFCYQRSEDIVFMKLLEGTALPIRLGAKLMHVDPSYIRFAGPAYMERTKGGKVLERYDARSVWEQMYLGRVDASAQY